MRLLTKPQMVISLLNLAMQVIEDRIARGLAMVIGLLDPDVIVIGGPLADSQRLFTAVPRKWPGYIRTSQANDILKPVCEDTKTLAGNLSDWGCRAETLFVIPPT